MDISEVKQCVKSAIKKLGVQNRAHAFVEIIQKRDLKLITKQNHK